MAGNRTGATAATGNEGQEQDAKEQDATQEQDAKRSAQGQQAAKLSGSPADVRRRKRAELAAQLREIDAADQADGVDQTPPDKVIHLSDGDTVEISGAVPTHHDNGNGLRRVLRFDPID